MLRRSGFNLLTEPLSPSATSRSSHLSPSILYSHLYCLPTLLVLILSAASFHLLTPFSPFKPPLCSLSRLTNWVITSLRSGEHQLRSGLFKLGFNLFFPFSLSLPVQIHIPVFSFFPRECKATIKPNFHHSSLTTLNLVFVQ